MASLRSSGGRMKVQTFAGRTLLPGVEGCPAASMCSFHAGDDRVGVTRELMMQSLGNI